MYGWYVCMVVYVMYVLGCDSIYFCTANVLDKNNIVDKLIDLVSFFS